MMKKVTPISAKNTRPMAATEAENCRFLKYETSSAGCSMRDSYQTKPARMTRPPSVVTQTSGLVKSPYWPPLMMP